ncbi:MAG: DUF3488 and transglutaminase-like domain-containing protein [Bdellovibrionales bacterium]|jgi:transglutaminase-like putative cysteine protease|nr:DUF3488 and transglutaminase-like domain-containing protein [Bdellovibrionales bacterium]
MALQTRSDMELWDRPFQTLLLGVLAFNIAAHAMNVPWWALVASAIALAWKIGHLYFSWRLPPKKLLYSSGLLIGFAVFWEYKTALGHEAATPILVFLASLKLLETNRDRDAMFIIVTSYFLLMTHLLHSQSLGSTLFMALDVALITTLMFQLHRADRRITRKSLRPIGRLLVLTIPIWFCLFLVFPRFQLKLFQTEQKAQATGFSEEINPGSVSNLVQSDEVAFRVRFLAGPRYNPESLYWRGATLYEADDLKWNPRSESEQRRLGTSPSELPLQNTPEEHPERPRALHYEVITEPGQGHAVFTLPYLVRFEASPPMNTLRPFITNDRLVRLTFQRPDRMLYSALSLPAPEAPALAQTNLTRSEKEASLKLTKTSPAVRKLATELKRGVQTPEQAMRRIDAWFVENGFRYTLTPENGPVATLDDFLFKKRQGFCEHYAAASATLLRAMGFSARVIVGYQGGKWNDISNALLVRSRDAHAWIEVFVPSETNVSRGTWRTYDPTAVIAPLRLRIGGDFLTLPEEQQRSLVSETEIEKIGKNLFLHAFDRTLLIWDYAQMSWTQFLLNYDQSGQRNFLNNLLNSVGLSGSPLMLTILIAIFFAICLRLIFLWRSRGPASTQLDREWAAFERELKHLGIYESIEDGPLTLKSRTESIPIQNGIDAFMDLQYGPPLEPAKTRERLRDIRDARREARRLRVGLST